MKASLNTVDLEGADFRKMVLAVRVTSLLGLCLLLASVRVRTDDYVMLTVCLSACAHVT